MRKFLRDILMRVSQALPNGAANVTSAASIDLGAHASRDDFVANMELLLSAPALNTTQMPNAKTMTYDLLGSANANLSAPTITITAAIVQTGAGGAGCAAAEYRFKPPSNTPRYWGFKATGSGSGDASGAAATLDATF